MPRLQGQRQALFHPTPPPPQGSFQQESTPVITTGLWRGLPVISEPKSRLRSGKTCTRSCPTLHLTTCSARHSFPPGSLLTLLALLAVSPGRVLSPISPGSSVVQHQPGIGHWPLGDLPHPSGLILPGGSLPPPNPS